jgi:2,5-diketo-D-gluconate reductase A
VQPLPVGKGKPEDADMRSVPGASSGWAVSWNRSSSALADVPNVRLSDGVEIPQVGFGVFQIPAEDTQRAVETALEAGYRHIDTAAAYRNERGVAAGIAASGLRRDEIFVTTKLWNTEQGFDSTLAAFDRSIEALDSERVDLYLIHWPAPSRDLYLDTWRAFERIKAEGGARSIGVSNFRVADLERLAREAEQMPTINQIELHPLHRQDELRAWHAEHGIVTEAWSPLAQGEILADDTLVTIAARHEKTVAQVILRWHLQLGNVVIPKSVTPERIRANLDLFDFELSDHDLAAIARLDAGHRTGPDPGTFGAP